MAKKNGISVRFWGVRGGVPCPGPSTTRYGGNTACVEVDLGGYTLIFDAGSGIRQLGHALNKRAPVTADILFSHTPFERISGIPFLSPAYHPENSFRIWAGHLPIGQSVEDVLTGLMVDPVFPVPMAIMAAALEFNDFRAGETVPVPVSGLRLFSAALNRTVPVTGYRVEWGGKSLCYVSDLIAGPGGDLVAAQALLDGADMAVINTAEHVPGAADWRDAVALCEKAGVGTCVTFHHRPGDDDDAMDAIAAEAEALRPGTIVAREGLTLTP